MTQTRRCCALHTYLKCRRANTARSITSIDLSATETNLSIGVVHFQSGSLSGIRRMETALSTMTDCYGRSVDCVGIIDNHVVVPAAICFVHLFATLTKSCDRSSALSCFDCRCHFVIYVNIQLYCYASLFCALILRQSWICMSCMCLYVTLLQRRLCTQYGQVILILSVSCSTSILSIPILRYRHPNP